MIFSPPRNPDRSSSGNRCSRFLLVNYFLSRIINDDSTYPFISYLSDLLAKSKPSDEAVIKLHDCIEKVAVTLGQDSTDVFRALLAKLIEEPEEKQTFDRLLEMAEKLAAKH